jgi:hypothetical protein
MRKLLTICAILLSLSVTAQWQLTGSKVRYVNGIGIPTKDTAAGVAADSSQILIRPADSSLYIKYKRTWQKVGAGGGGISGSGTTNYIPKFTSSSALGNSSIVDSASAVAMTINPSGNVGIGTTSPSGKLNISSSIGDQIRLDRTSQTARAIVISGSDQFSFGTWASATQMNLTTGGNLLLNTTTDNGVDKLQVSGSMNVSAKATAQTLSATSNASVGGTFNVSGISTFSSRINITSGGIRLGTAGNGESLSAFLGGSNDAYPLVNNAYVIPGTGWRYLNNGPASIISYESGDLIYYNCPTNSSGADAVLGTITHRMRITAAGNMSIGSYTAPAARLVVDGTALINTNTDNGVDKLQVSGSMNVSTLATTTNLSVTTNATVGGDATISGNTRINGLVGINTAPSSYALSFAATGSNIINYTTQSTNNINLFAHSSSQQFGQIGNASGALSGGSNNDMAVGALGASNNLILYTNSAERVRVTSAGRVLANTTTDNGVDQLQVNGSISGNGFEQAYLARTTTYTATTNDYFIDCTTGTFTVNLFTAVGNTGRILIIKNSGTGTITVDPNGSQTIDGATTQSLATQWSRVHIISDGANWKIISN